jgi:O-antigen/teichoic acid export membrane protein
VLALWALLSTLFHPLNARLMGEGRARVLLTATAVAAVVNLLLLGVLVPPGLVGLGATGAALATFGAVAASYAYARLWSARNHQVVFWDPSMLRVLAAATLTGVAWWGAAAVMPPSWLDHAWKLALLGLAGTGLYGLLLQLVGELTQDDRDTLKRLLHPSSWKPR